MCVLSDGGGGGGGDGDGERCYVCKREGRKDVNQNC